MNPKKTQILVVGDVEGNFDQLYQRVDEIKKKQNFDVLLCVGNFFGENELNLDLYKTGEKKASILTYFILVDEEIKHIPIEISKTGGQLCENIHFIGKMGMKEILGVSIAYFSPISLNLSDINERAEYDTFLSKFSLQSFKGVDILLTNQWSKGILKNIPDSNLPINGLSMLDYDLVGDEIISNIANIVVPRYHFSSSQIKKNVYFERVPYKNTKKFLDSKTSHVTRFFSLASAFNSQKRKFLYAFAIFPLHSIPKTELYAVPSNSTESPFRDPEEEEKRLIKKQKLNEEKVESSFVGDASKARPSYAMPSNTKKYVSSGARTNECWFCLVSSVCEKHSILKIGTHFYVAIAKGGINDSHMLLIPVQHTPCTTALSKAAVQEMIAWKDALARMFQERNENVIFCEHNQPGHNPDLQHLIFQVLGLPKNIMIQNYFEKIAFNEGLEWSRCNINSTNIQSQIRSIAGNSSYVWVDVPSENLHLVGPIEKERFPFSFFRRTVVNAIGHPELEDWKRCVQPKNIEEKNAKTLCAELEKFCGEDLQ